jgi:hypothetical protein
MRLYLVGALLLVGASAAQAQTPAQRIAIAECGGMTHCRELVQNYPGTAIYVRRCAVGARGNAIDEAYCKNLIQSRIPQQHAANAGHYYSVCAQAFQRKNGGASCEKLVFKPLLDYFKGSAIAQALHR